MATIIIVADPNEQHWLFGTKDDGILTADPVDNSFALTPNTLRDSDGALWALGINGDGNLTTLPGRNTDELVDPVFQSPGGYLWQLVALPGGGLMLNPVGSVTPTARPGELFPPNDAYPPFTQPGGVGTPVFPEQAKGDGDGVPFEIGMGLWTAGCGHWFNHWMVQRDSALGQQVALVTCPLCGYIQSVIMPYDLIHSDNYYIIFA